MNRTYSFQKAPVAPRPRSGRANGAKPPPFGAGRFTVFHGARGAGPKGKRNGMYRHGLFFASFFDSRRSR
jgi:hypothetical protein